MVCIELGTPVRGLADVIDQDKHKSLTYKLLRRGRVAGLNSFRLTKNWISPVEDGKIGRVLFIMGDRTRLFLH